MIDDVLTESEERLLIEVIHIILQYEHPVGRAAIYKAHRGDKTRLQRVISYGVRHGYFVEMFDESVKHTPGRREVRLKVTALARRLHRSRSDVVKDFSVRKEAPKSERKKNVEIELWYDRTYTQSDASPSATVPKAFDIGKAQTLGVYLGCAVDDGDYVPLEEVLRQAPVSWHRYNKAYIVDVVRGAWLLLGAVMSTFTSNDVWMVSPGIIIADEVMEAGGREAYKAAHIDTRLSAWKWSK